MKRVGLAALGLACLVAGCVRTSDGAPVAADLGTTAASSAPSATTQPTQESDQSAFGVVPTKRAPVPPNTVACSQPIKPAVRMAAQVNDPQAPKITVGVPDGWSMSAGSGDIGGQLAGPDGMSATVTIAATQLDPAAAFKKYADDLMAEVGRQQRQRAARPTMRVQRAEADGCLVGYAAERRRIRGPHRPRLDQQRQRLSRRRARAGADGDTPDSMTPLRC